jgi:hypothetical protein
MTDPAAAVNRADDSRYYPYAPTGEELDSVTFVISATNSKPWIAKWREGVSMGWAVDNLALLAKVLESDGRKAAIDLAKDEGERIRALAAEAGVYVHDVLEALIYWAASPGRTGSDIAIPLLPEHLEDAWYHMGGGEYEPLTDVVDHMIDGFIAWVSQFNPRFLATEMTVYNQPLGVAGTLDQIIILDGYAISGGTGPRGEDEIIACPGSTLTLCVDTKTGRTPEGTWKEQLAAYRRMTECLLPMREIHPMPATDAGAVLHLRPDYPDGFLLMLVSAKDDEPAWERFQAAAKVYRERQTVKGKPGTAIRPLRADGTMPGPRLCDLAGEGYGRALSPLAKALGGAAELADVARFNEIELAAVKGIGPKLIEVIRQMLAERGLYLAGEAPETAKAA